MAKRTGRPVTPSEFAAECEVKRLCAKAARMAALIGRRYDCDADVMAAEGVEAIAAIAAKHIESSICNQAHMLLDGLKILVPEPQMKAT